MTWTRAVQGQSGVLTRMSHVQGQCSCHFLSGRVHSRLPDGFLPMYFFW